MTDNTMKAARPTVYVLGAGGHGKVVAEAAARSGQVFVAGFLDEDPAKWGSQLSGLPVAGGLDALPPGAAVALGVGSNEARLALLGRLGERRIPVVTIVHPAATVSSGAQIGEGTYIGPGAVVHVDARVGRGCILNSGSVVEHDNVLGDGVHVSPNAALGGNVEVGEGSHVGLGASVLPGIVIGPWTVVGAGAVVTRPLPGGVSAAGVPARILPPRPRASTRTT
jgi:acetyltransferase EpsM